jgi:hypothetical protein
MPDHIDTLICDAVRPEANGKLTLLGLLGEEVFVPQIPTQLASLAFVQRWRPSAGEPAGRSFVVSFDIRVPGLPAPIAIPAQPAIVPPGVRPSMNFVIQMQGFLVPQAGDYQLRTFVDGQLRFTHTFFIGLPPEAARNQLIGFNRPS